jgi:hypothetical protein
MTHVAGHMKLALAVLAAVLLLAGCGHAYTAHDPFVGTWRLGSDPPPWLVVAKVGSTYRVTFVGEGTITWGFTRHGNRLVHGQAGGKRSLVATYVPSTGHLLFSGDDLASPFNFHKQSDSTAIPSPLPS